MNTLSSFWAAIAPALGDHLWQSTLVALGAGLLALLLQKNHARVRYWLWLAASLKFLVPFSWLVAIGSRYASRVGAVSAPAVYVTVEQVTQPFTQSPMLGAAASSAPSAALTQLLPSLLPAVWLSGSLAVLALWYARWRRIAAMAKQAMPLTEGREIEALRGLEHSVGLATPIDIRLSRSTLEPGVFGIMTPILVWPEGISERLDDAQLKAVIAHELWHVRRRDNLAAAFHMLVEAIFWFHPLVWWLGARLVNERERACDEEVLEFGSERQIYAESILKVCEFCVGSPLPCVSGVTGADLKKRMVHIMSEHVVRKMDFTRRVLLSTFAIAAITAPLVFGLFHATPGRAQSQDDNASAIESIVESATIKPSELNTATYAGTKTHMIRMMYGPDGFEARNVTMRAILQEAYQLQANQIEGGPDWLDSDAFDVQVKLRKSAEDAPPSKQRMDQVKLTLQKLLAEHAGLVVHNKTKVLPTYALEIAENGPKLQPALSKEPDDMKFNAPVHMGKQQMRMEVAGNQVYGIGAQGISADDLAQQLSHQLGTPVVNKTGLQGRYDFNLHWSDAKASSGENETGSAASSEPSIFNAIQEQLGLKLQSQKAPTQVLVIDRLEKPAEN
jgi:bla regulator protein blaR1